MPAFPHKELIQSQILEYQAGERAKAKPTWREVDGEWHMLLGNDSVARLIPTTDHPHYRWMSIIDGDIHDYGWNVVDFETLEIAKEDIEQWLIHALRGETFRP